MCRDTQKNANILQYTDEFFVSVFYFVWTAANIMVLIYIFEMIKNICLTEYNMNSIHNLFTEPHTHTHKKKNAYVKACGFILLKVNFKLYYVIF